MQNLTDVASSVEINNNKLTAVLPTRDGMVTARFKLYLEQQTASDGLALSDLAAASPALVIVEAQLIEGASLGFDDVLAMAQAWFGGETAGSGKSFAVAVAPPAVPAELIAALGVVPE